MKTRLVIVIPAYNEEVTISDVVTRCLKAPDAGRFDTTVLVVDDGSTDATARLAKEAGAVVFKHSANMGVGHAFHSGLEQGLRRGCKILLNIDADGQFDPATIPALIAPILEGRADVAIASRFKDPALVPEMTRVRLVGNRLMSRLISSIAGIRFYDVSCGFRAYNREAALQLNLWGKFTYTQESILDLIAKDVRIEEVPIRVQGIRTHGKSKVAANLFRYGFRSAKIIMHAYRDFWPMHFFGWCSLIFVVPGFGLLCFLFMHRLRTGRFSPQIWSGFTGAGLLAMGLLVLATGLIGEMLKRIRLNQEMLLYYERKQLYGNDATIPAGRNSD